MRNFHTMSNEESWIRLAVTYPAPDEENLALICFEQELYAILYASGAATIHEQDETTLDGKLLAPGTKRLWCYFTDSQAIQAAEVKAGIEQKARTEHIDLTTALESFDDQSWKDGWKAYFKPAQVSPRIAIRTPWSTFTPEPGVNVIVIEPGMAFGTGLHETTQLCIRAIDRLSQAQAFKSMLDVGCGSGVLSIAGALCGIPVVRGVDNDPVCIDVSRENGALNRVNATFDGTDIWDVTQQYELVVANIISSVLKSLKEDIKTALAVGGTLVLSGILAEEREEVEAAFMEGIPLEQISHETLGEWCSLTFVKRK